MAAFSHPSPPPPPRWSSDGEADKNFLESCDYFVVFASFFLHRPDPAAWVVCQRRCDSSDVQQQKQNKAESPREEWYYYPTDGSCRVLLLSSEWPDQPQCLSSAERGGLKRRGDTTLSCFWREIRWVGFPRKAYGFVLCFRLADVCLVTNIFFFYVFICTLDTGGQTHTKKRFLRKLFNHQEFTLCRWIVIWPFFVLVMRTT